MVLIAECSYFRVVLIAKFYCIYFNSLTHSCPVNSSTSTHWTGPFPIEGVTGWFLLLPCFIETSKLYRNSVDSDQTSRFAASDLGLHRLPLSLLCNARHNRDN